MKTELQLLSDEKLLEEIKRQWYEITCFEYDAWLERREFSVADDYLMSDIEEHIDKLEKAYKGRGLTLPDRQEYKNQFWPEDDIREPEYDEDYEDDR